MHASQSHQQTTSVSVLQTQQHIMMGRQSPLIISASGSTTATSMNQPLSSPTITVAGGSQSTLSISTMPIANSIAAGVDNMGQNSPLSINNANSLLSAAAVPLSAAAAALSTSSSISIVRPASPSVHTIGAVSVRNVSPMTSGGIKITYDKPVNNNRVAQLQESESPVLAGRRSR